MILIIMLFITFCSSYDISLYSIIVCNIFGMNLSDIS